MEKIRRKSLLYKTGVEYGNFCLNHVVGCSHGCNFPCYAMLIAKRYGRIKDYSDWCKPKLVENALELLDKEIPKYKKDINFVHLCFMTDPFMQGYKEVEELTLQIIAKLNGDGIKCTVLTKGIYPVVLTDKEKYGSENEYGITLVSLNEDFKNKFEPFSASVKDRIKALKYLHDNGLKTWVSIEPYPTPNLVEQDLIGILEKVSFVDKIIFGKLNYNKIATQFKNKDQFYEDCTKQTIDFCKERGIDCHIKEGTQKTYNSNTENIFEKKPDVPVTKQNNSKKPARQKKIKFSNDYEKLPLNWDGTAATLIAVYPEKMENIKNKYSAFWKKDTKVRNQEKYYSLNFKDALILIFLHHDTGTLFPTIRRNYEQKFEYYVGSIGETFILTKAN